MNQQVVKRNNDKRKTVSFMLLLVFVAFSILLPFSVSIETAHAAVLTAPANNLGLTGYWPFEDGAGTTAFGDHSGNGNHGTVGSGSGGGGGGGGGFVVGQTREAANTSTGTQDFTITWSDDGSYVPTAIEVYIGKATTDDTSHGGSFFSVGAATDASNQWVRGFASEDGVASTDIAGYFNTGDVAVIISDNADSVDAAASLVSFGVDTVTLNWTNAPSQAYFVTIKAFTGTEAAVAGTINPSTSDTGTVNATDLGATAEYVLFSGTVQTVNGGPSLASGAGLVLGYYTYDGTTARNYGIGAGVRNAQSAPDLNYRWGSNWAGAEARNGGSTLDAHFALSPHSDGFTVTSYYVQSGINDAVAGYLALDLPDEIEARVGSIATPTSTGNQSYTGVGFKPQSLTLIGGYSKVGPTVRGNTTPAASTLGSPYQDSFFFGTALTSGEYTISLTNYEIGSTKGFKTLESSALARVITDTGTERVAASLSSFDLDGFTLNYSTVGEAVDWIFVAFKEGGGGSSDASPAFVTGRYGKGLSFNGTNTSVDFGDVGTANTISFWLKTSDVTSQKLINIDGTDQIETNSSGEVVATSFPGTVTVYVDGSSSSQTLTADRWHHVVITSTTGVDASTFEVGKVGDTYFDGLIDEVRTYNRVVAASEVTRLTGTGRTTIGGGYERAYSNGLVGYWSFDGNDTGSAASVFYDRSGAGNDGTAAGGTVLSADGRLGQAVHFPASENDSRISIGSDSSIDNIFDGGGTIAAWIHPTGWGDDEGQGAGGSIFSKTNASLGIGYWFAVSDLTDSLVFASLRSNVGQWSAPSNAITLDTWHHVAVTYDDSSNSNDPTLYIDGVEQSITEFATPSGTPASDAPYDAMIGSLTDTLYNFDGKIDELRVYDRALTSREIQGLYNLGQAKINPSMSSKLTGGLVGMWDFNGKSMDWANDKALDVSGNGKDGTLQNNPTPAVGVVGQSLRFNGTSTYIALPDLSVSEDRIFSYSAWVKSDTEQSGYILSEGRTTSINSHGGLVYLDGLPRALWRNDAGTDSIVDGSTPINDGRWHHIASVGNGSTLTLYVDGEVDGTPVSMSGAQTINVGAIGRLTRSTPGAYFLGQIDEVRIYDRALSTSEIRSLYAMGRGLVNSGGGAVSAGDTNPPTPDPMTFEMEPLTPGTSIVAASMRANTATDVEGSTPVEYYFTFHQCSTNGGTDGSDSGWQTSTSYIDHPSTNGKCYGYSVKASDTEGNETESSAIFEVTAVAMGG